MPPTCRVRAAYPFHGVAPEGWILWAVLHECGLTENLGCPSGSGTPRVVRCGAGDAVPANAPRAEAEELDAFDLLGT